MNVGLEAAELLVEAASTSDRSELLVSRIGDDLRKVAKEVRRQIDEVEDLIAHSKKQAGIDGCRY